MSDLQCPATLLVTRHGDARYPVQGVLGDDGGTLTDLGRRQAASLAEQVRPRRVAVVYTSTMSRAEQTGRIVADRLGVGVRGEAGLQEFAVGALVGAPIADPRLRQVCDAWLQGDLAAAIPGGESGHEVLERCRAALSGLADVHRGETVVVVSHGGVMSLVLPRLAGNVPNDLARDRSVPHCVPVELRVDADGWQLVDWPGSDRPGKTD